MLGGTLKAADYATFDHFVDPVGPVPFWQLPSNVLNRSTVNTINISIDSKLY